MDVLLEANLPPGVINVVTGFGNKIVEPLVDQKMLEWYLLQVVPMEVV